MITVLQAKKGVNLTKTFSASGTVPYSRAKYFTHYSEPVTDIYSLSAVLTDLADKKDCCVIRGQFNPDHNSLELFDGKYLPRKAQLFNDLPLNWVMLDVDGYKTSLPPLEAIQHFISTQLPKVFHGRSFHWQLSSSYNTKGKEGLLKAHLWFWLDTAYDSPTLKRWALTVPVDASVFNTVSVHYTASPIFTDIPDPVATRSGLYEGLVDSVPLVLTPVPSVERDYAVEKVADPDWPLSRITSEVLPKISPDLSNDEWVKVGMALHHQGGGGSEWLAAFDAWSEPGQSYTTEVCETRWDSFERSQGSTVSIGTLLHMANVSRSSVADDDEFDNLTTESQQDAPPSKAFTWATGGQFNTGRATGWLIKGLLPRAELGVLYGASSSGKSFKMLSIAMHIVHGWEWRGHRVTQGRVAYLAAEGAAGFKHRIDAFAREFKCDIDHPNLIISRDPVNFLVKAEAKAFALSLVEYRPAMVVIDTFARVTPGGNENSGEDMGKALAHCQLVHDLTGAMVVLIHHSGKDASKGARGWSGLRAAADWEAEVIKAQSGDTRVLTVTKQKDGEDGQEFGFTLRTVSLDMDTEGDMITSCVVEEAEAGGVVRQVKMQLGKLENILIEEAQNLVGLDGSLPDVNTLIESAVSQIPFDGVNNKRDQRSGNLSRAYKKLIERSILREEEGRVSVL